MLVALLIVDIPTMHTLLMILSLILEPDRSCVRNECHLTAIRSATYAYNKTWPNYQICREARIINHNLRASLNF